MSTTPETSEELAEKLRKSEEARQRITETMQDQLHVIQSNGVELELLRRQLQEAKKTHERMTEKLSESRHAFNTLDAEIRHAIRVSGLVPVKGGTADLVRHLVAFATQLLSQIVATEEERRKEIRLTFDNIEGCFLVKFGNGHSLKFSKPKSLAGNVENWLANLRHQAD